MRAARVSTVVARSYTVRGLDIRNFAVHALRTVICQFSIHVSRYGFTALLTLVLGRTLLGRASRRYCQLWYKKARVFWEVSVPCGLWLWVRACVSY